MPHGGGAGIGRGFVRASTEMKPRIANDTRFGAMSIQRFHHGVALAETLARSEPASGSDSAAREEFSAAPSAARYHALRRCESAACPLPSPMLLAKLIQARRAPQ